MNWVTEKEVAEAAKTRKGAIAISRKAWLQRYRATKKELERIIDTGDWKGRRYIMIYESLCGLCVYYSYDGRQGKNCGGCPLKENDPDLCCSEWREVKDSVDNFNYKAYHKAAGRMYRRLLKIK